MVIPRSKQRAARHLSTRMSTRSSASGSVNKPGSSSFAPPSLYGSSSPQALPLLEYGGYGDAVDCGDPDPTPSPPPPPPPGPPRKSPKPAPMMGIPTTADTLIMDIPTPRQRSCAVQPIGATFASPLANHRSARGPLVFLGFPAFYHRLQLRSGTL